MVSPPLLPGWMVQVNLNLFLDWSLKRVLLLWDVLGTPELLLKRASKGNWRAVLRLKQKKRFEQLLKE